MKTRLTLIALSIALTTLTACNSVIDEQSVSSQEPPASTNRAKMYDKASSRVVMHEQMALSAPAAVHGMVAPTNAFVAPPVNTEKYAHLDENRVFSVAENPLSTFSVDVDTGSYTNVRRMLNNGELPPADAVRVEEFINYFDYAANSAAEDFSKQPFTVLTEVAPSPWNETNQLLRITLKSKPLAVNAMKKNNLVFLVDVSGSMRSADKLDLLKKSLKLLVKQMDKEDRIAIVTYAGASGVALESTPGNQWLTIEQGIDQLEAGGSTHGSAGIRLAYDLASQAFDKTANNRVILATDGDFNVGTVNHEALISLIEQQRDKGIALTTLGFGRGNYNDQLMEQLADKGNGNHAYIDSLMEAKKVLVDEIGSQLEVVASDVKLQVEFNPASVSEYRLIGYENRRLNREDFNNDRVDAGEIGAGHSVTALYEITPAGHRGQLDKLRYAPTAADEPSATAHVGELAFIKLRYKQPGAQQSQLLSYRVDANDSISQLSAASNDFRFAAAVAAFAQKLKGGRYLQDYGYQDIYQLAEASRGADSRGLRSHFLQLLDLGKTLTM